MIPVRSKNRATWRKEEETKGKDEPAGFVEAHVVLRNSTKNETKCKRMMSIADRMHPASAASNCEAGMPVKSLCPLASRRAENVTSKVTVVAVANACMRGRLRIQL